MRLLVSVRDADEAAAALAGGADFIDVKEPARGALGYADAAALEAIATTVGSAAPLSAALGEIGDHLPSYDFAALANYRFAKLGLVGGQSLNNWPQRWRAVVEMLPASVFPVAVVYADARECGAPTLAEVLPHACALHCAGVLVDTFAKDGRTIFDFISSEQLADEVAVVRRAGLRSLVAGSIRANHVEQLATISPDVVAVRGAVCDGGRAGKVSAQLVANFHRELARYSHYHHESRASAKTF